MININRSKEFLRPSQIVQKRRKRRIKSSVLTSALFVIILTCSIFFMRLDFFKIQNIEIRGNVSIKSEEVTNSVLKIISGKYLYVIPKENILIYPSSEIKKELEKEFPRIDTLKISTTKNDILISLTERKPQALWCGVSFEETVDQCSFVDINGFVFSKAPQFDGSSYLKFYGNSLDNEGTSTEEIKTSWQLVTDTEYTSILNFINKSKEIGIEIDAVEISDAKTYRFQIKNNGLLLVNRKNDLSQTLENVKAALLNNLLWNVNKSKKTKKLAQLEYIDMRFGSKVFYKFVGN